MEGRNYRNWSQRVEQLEPARSQTSRAYVAAAYLGSAEGHRYRLNYHTFGVGYFLLRQSNSASFTVAIAQSTSSLREYAHLGRDRVHFS